MVLYLELKFLVLLVAGGRSRLLGLLLGFLLLGQQQNFLFSGPNIT